MTVGEVTGVPLPGRQHARFDTLAALGPRHGRGIRERSVRHVARAAVGGGIEGLHPLVRAEETQFLRLQRARRAKIVALDVPLLLETGGERRCDAVAVVSAPRLVQLQRVLARPGMTRAKLNGIETRQMPDREKRRRADFVIPTGLGRRPAWVALKKAVRKVREP